jgi:hypothetical protein
MQDDMVPQQTKNQLDQRIKAVQPADINNASNLMDTIENDIDQAVIAADLARSQALQTFGTNLAQQEGIQTQRMPAPANVLPPNYHQPDIHGAGKAMLTRFIASQEWGSSEDRHSIDAEVQQEIDLMRTTGQAAEVQLTSGGKTLNGNFFAGKGQNLKASNYQPDVTKPVVLLLTGSGGSAQDQGLDIAKFYASEEVSVLSVNYRGFGDSDHEYPSEKSLQEDAQAMLEYLLKMGYPADKIVIHGFSLGGAVGALTEANNTAANPNMKFMGAVTDRTMTSSYDAAKAHVGGGVKGAIAGGLASVSAGSLNTKKALTEGVDPTTHRVVTADKDDLGAAQQLRGNLHGIPNSNVTGQDTLAKHLDSKKMIETNRADILAMFQQQGHAPSGNADPLFDLIEQNDICKRFQLDLKKCQLFVNTIPAIRARIQQEPNRADVTQTLRRVNGYQALLQTIQQSGVLATQLGQNAGMQGDYNACNNPINAFDTFLNNMQQDMTSRTVTEVQPPDQNNVATRVANARNAIRGDLATKYNPGAIDTMEDDGTKKLDNDITKQFKIVIQRLRAFEAAAADNGTTIAALIALLESLDNGARATLNLYAKEYGSIYADSKSDSTKSCATMPATSGISRGNNSRNTAATS